MEKERSSLHGLIGECYETLSPADRRLADLILNFPAGLPGYSASELAQMASTSNAAVSRFVKRLGFGNFEEMRRQAREEAEGGAPIYMLDRAESADDIVERHAATAAENIRRTAAGIDSGAFRDFTDRIVKARRVWIAGYRHGFAIATYLRWSLLHARGDIHLLPMGGDTLGEHLIDLKPDDVLIIMAMRRRVPAILKLVRFAEKKGVPTALLVDPGFVETPSIKWCFRISTNTGGPIDDHAAALMFSHVITEQVLVSLGKNARSRLAEIDVIHDALGEL